MKKGIFIFAAAIVAGPLSASATLLLNEQFNYADGALTSANGGANVSGGAWATLSGTTANISVSSGQVVGLTHGSGSREDVARSFSGTDISTGTLFSAFNLTVTTAPTAGSDYFFAFAGNANTTYRARTFLSAPAVPGGSFRLGLENDAATTTIFTADLSIGTYAVIVAVNAATNLSSLWVGADFSSLVEATPTIVDNVAPVSTAAVGRVALRQGGSITVANSVNVDDLRVADTFSEAATPVPEPSSLFTLLGGVGALCGLRRLRSRAAMRSLPFPRPMAG